MPISKNRYDYIKLYRPKGMKFSHGKTEITAEAAVSSAIQAFNTEFGAFNQEIALIEVLGVTGGWAASIFEIPEPRYDRSSLR